MKNIFFRTTSLWASVLYMALGLVLTFWPGMSGTVFAGASPLHSFCTPHIASGIL